MTTITDIGTLIVKTPETCGGRPRIAGRRLSVQQIAVLATQNKLTPEQIIQEYPCYRDKKANNFQIQRLPKIRVKDVKSIYITHITLPIIVYNLISYLVNRTYICILCYILLDLSILLEN